VLVHALQPPLEALVAPAERHPLDQDLVEQVRVALRMETRELDERERGAVRRGELAIR
jgi:hypothetical protein